MLLLLLGILDGSYVALQLRSSLTDVRETLERGTRQLRRTKLSDAQLSFAQALRAARSASDLTRHPSFVLASWLPEVGRDVRAVDVITDVAALSARAGVIVAQDVGEALDEDGANLAAALYSKGRVDFDTLETVRPLLEKVEGILDDAADRLEAAPQPRIGGIGDGLDGARSKLAAASDSIHRAVVLSAALPSLLARDGERRYLLVFQTPNEARATGGFIGLYGILEASDGNLGLAHVGPIGQLTSRTTGSVAAPTKWFKRQYGPWSALRQWQQANLSPNFPVVSEVLLRMYESATGDVLDGVMAMDPIALQELTRATGPLKAPGLAASVDPDNAVEVILRDAYVAFEDRERAQNRYLGGLIRDFWAQLNTHVDAASLGDGLANAVATQHLKFFARDREDQAALHDLGADGSFTAAAPNVQLVFHNNFGLNKVDYFLRRKLQMTIELAANGDAHIETTVIQKNEAPVGLPRVLAGKATGGHPAGTNHMLLSLLLPERSKVEEVIVEGRNVHPLRGNDAGLPLVFDVLDIAPGETARATFSYRVPQAFDLGDGARGFRLTLFPQATVRPDDYSITVIPPRGFLAKVGHGHDVSDARGSVSLDGALSRPTPLDIDLVPR